MGGKGELSILSPTLFQVPLGRDLSRYSLKRRAYLQVKSREVKVAARLLNRPGHPKCTIDMDIILILGTIQGATGMLVKHGVIRTLVYLFMKHVCKSIVYNYMPVRSLGRERASFPWVLKSSYRKNRKFRCHYSDGNENVKKAKG